MQKSYLAIVGLLLLSSIALFNLSSLSASERPQKAAFEAWRQQFNKNYDSQFEKNYRYNIFYQKLLMVQEHNSKYKLGEELSTLRLNFYSDLTSEEINKGYFSEHTTRSVGDFQCKGPQYAKKDNFDANFTLDLNMISTEVYDQDISKCTSGYAFATAAAVESLMYIIFKKLVPLSAQQLVDCSKETENPGCAGGNPIDSLHYLMNRGVMKSADYPYVARNQECQYTAAKKIFELENCTKVDSNLVMLKSQIFHQPVIVSFDASDDKFIHFGGGLYVPPKGCGSKINHHMLAVGWGEVTTVVSKLKKTHYYIIVKNSMGMKWGENGFGKIEVQVDKNPNNACGLLKEIYFPFG